MHQEFFTVESLLTGENVREVELRQFLSLYVSRETKHTSHISLFEFLILFEI